MKLKDQHKTFTMSFPVASFWTAIFLLHRHISDVLRYAEGAGWQHGAMTVAIRQVMGLQNKGWRNGRELGITVLGLNETQERMFFWWVWRLSEIKTKERFVSSYFNQTTFLFLAFRAQYPAYSNVWLHVNSKHSLRLVSVEFRSHQKSDLHNMCLCVCMCFCASVFH